MTRYFILLLLVSGGCVLAAQSPTPTTDRHRLDFARTYFEYGASVLPSFSGRQLSGGQLQDIEHPASIGQYFNWGAFHFWGHAEFYVTIPLGRHLLQANEVNRYELHHSVATGFRLYPWRVQEHSVRPYAGLHWGALDLQLREEQTALSKDFQLNYEAGFTYHRKQLGARLGVNYFPDHRWDYPLSTGHKETIRTPAYAVHFGLFYSFDSSNDTKPDNVAEWNAFPPVSPLSYGAVSFGSFFVGAGLSNSYSLARSSYNQEQLPYLKDRLVSKVFADLAAGYQWNRANMFAALSYRNPVFETSGFGDRQEIRKHSLALELNKYLTDYTGFAPYVGLNVAYDRLRYEEEVNGHRRAVDLDDRFEWGINFGWDIVPGKTNEALVIRTNLRWYPRSAFEIDGRPFRFQQLEYNLLQLIFYPGRLKKRS